MCPALRLYGAHHSDYRVNERTDFITVAVPNGVPDTVTDA
jgi:hypothetical protein